MRRREKGGKVHEVLCHHRLDEYLHEYIATAGLEADKKGLLFRSVANKKGTAPSPINRWPSPTYTP